MFTAQHKRSLIVASSWLVSAEAIKKHSPRRVSVPLVKLNEYSTNLVEKPKLGGKFDRQQNLMEYPERPIA